MMSDDLVLAIIALVLSAVNLLFVFIEHLKNNHDEE